MLLENKRSSFLTFSLGLPINVHCIRSVRLEKVLTSDSGF